MSKLFSVSFVCADRDLYELMTRLEQMPVQHIMARPIPQDHPAVETAPRLEVTAVVKAKPKPDGGKGKSRPLRSDAGFYALTEASQRFLDERQGTFTAKDFEAFLLPFAQGRPFQAGSRLAYYHQQGKLRRLETGVYEVIRDQPKQEETAA